MGSKTAWMMALAVVSGGLLVSVSSAEATVLVPGKGGKLGLPWKQFTKCKPGFKVVHPGTRSERCVRASEQKCSPVTCRMYCRCGWAKGPDGCDRCACAKCGDAKPAKCKQGFRFVLGKCRKALPVKPRKCKDGYRSFLGTCRKLTTPGPTGLKVCAVGKRIHFRDACKCPPGTRVKTLNRSYHLCERVSADAGRACPAGTKRVQVMCIKAPCPARCVPISQTPTGSIGKVPFVKPLSVKPLIKPLSVKPVIKPLSVKPLIKPLSVKPLIKPLSVKPLAKPPVLMPGGIDGNFRN